MASTGGFTLDTQRKVLYDDIMEEPEAANQLLHI
jgi:hypothetical protein